MEELRPDVMSKGTVMEDVDKSDGMVVAPTESLDDRSERAADFEVDERLSCSNTDFGGGDPAQ